MTKKFETLDEVIHNVWETEGLKKGVVATAMGKPLSTLSREVSMYDAGAKLGVTDLIPFMKAAGTIAPLHFMADSMGYKLVPKLGKPDTDTIQHEILQGYEVTSSFLKAANDPNGNYFHIVSLRSEADKELDDVVNLCKKYINRQ